MGLGGQGNRGLGLGGHHLGAAGGLAFDFTTAVVANGVYVAPPAFLSLSCPTSGRTSQSSATGVVSGLGANAWRVRNVGNGSGLSIEAPRTSSLLYQQTFSGGHWLGNAGATFTTTTGPDGVANDALQATWTTAASSGVINQSTIAGGSFPGYLSFWAQWASGATSIDAFDIDAGAFVDNVALSTSWARNGQAIGTVSGGSNLGFGHASAAPAGTANIFGPQVEFGALYPSSVFPTVATAATRAADVLSTTAAIAPGGRLNMTGVFSPNFATAEQSFDMPLLWWSAGNQVYLRQTDSKIVVTVGGSVVLTSAVLAWSREQGLSVVCHLTPAGALMLTVSGATSGNGTTTVSGVAAFTTTPTAYVMGTSAGAQECVDLRQIGFAAP